MKRRFYIGYFYFLLPLVFFFFIDYAKDVDDIWFLLAHGRYVLTHGIPHVEFLTIHSGFHFVMQQWAFSVILYFVYHTLGSVGVCLFTFVFYLLILFFLYRFCMVISSNNQYYSCLISSVITLLLGLNFILPRPQIISLLCLLIVLYLLEMFSKNKFYKGIYFIPLISVVLINFHASMWLMLFVFCLPYLAEFFYFTIKNKDQKVFVLLFIMVISFVVGFLNPYGWEAMTYSVHSYGIASINLLIREMHSFSLDFSDSFLFLNSSLILLLCTVFIICFIMNYKKFSIHSVCLFLGLSFMSFCNLRNTSFLLIGTVPFFVYFFSKDINYSFSIKNFSLFFIVFIVLFLFRYQQNFFRLQDPVREEIVSYLDSHVDSDVIIFTYFNDGPYLEYHGYPVYMDTRAEVFLKSNNHKKDVFDEYYSVLIGDIDFEQFIRTYQFTHFVVHKDTPIYDYLEKNDQYCLVYEDLENDIFLFSSLF